MEEQKYGEIVITEKEKKVRKMTKNELITALNNHRQLLFEERENKRKEKQELIDKYKEIIDKKDEEMRELKEFWDYMQAKKIVDKYEGNDCDCD